MLKKDDLEQYQYIIHHLLHRYNITYDYDEFFQLLLIRMWQLITQYDPTLSLSLSSYLYSRLRYYLFDLLRSKARQIAMADIAHTHLHAIDSISITENQILLEQFLKTLNTHEQRWIQLAYLGYKQYEIAHHMNRSLSSVKLYKKSVKNKFFSFLNYGKE
ncbi:sigma-70 family RNA polymerase sigma factor [Staphylococcus kloosii]|uniref:sigma-70 family RNA polymerase sigma factor n=1 Tax=Staphylococcus kloosii TaxID=29384 RepID=UPI0028A4203F|nr:sigma-70 family RNA polymerase sigma factor [Staphylococcus kloosii]MDT3960001.1 sigma-70 family RNA polymerase sigma factor [Staphylococcus kloosii]